jgi:hypothetical protein
MTCCCASCDRKTQDYPIFCYMCKIITVPSIVTWKNIEYNIKNIELEGIAFTMMVFLYNN